VERTISDKGYNLITGICITSNEGLSFNYIII
jgi:hypothetical protein